MCCGVAANAGVIIDRHNGELSVDSAGISSYVPGDLGPVVQGDRPAETGNAAASASVVAFIWVTFPDPVVADNGVVLKGDRAFQVEDAPAEAI